MARRNYRKSSKKMQPSVETLTFNLGSVPKSESEGPGIIPNQKTYFLDLSQVASLVNRRFYRQGLVWAVGGFRLNSVNVVANTSSRVVDAPEGAITIQKLPQSWVMSNAWEKGFRAWLKQQNQATEENESVKAKYNDFKIFFDETHLDLGFEDNILPAVYDAGFVSPYASMNVASPGEWQASQIVIPNFTSPGVNYEPFIQAVGDDVGGTGGSISLIKAYEDSRSVPQSPDPAVPAGVDSADNIYRAMFDVGDNMEDVLENVVGKNDELPYPQIHYPGGDTQLEGAQCHSIENITGSTIGGVTYLKGGSFPCGLIRIDIFNTDNEFDMLNILQVDLVPGTHRGYLAESMTEM